MVPCRFVGGPFDGQVRNVTVLDGPERFQDRFPEHLRMPVLPPLGSPDDPVPTASQISQIVTYERVRRAIDRHELVPEYHSVAERPRSRSSRSPCDHRSRR